MVGLEHIVMHVGLCKAVARLSAQTTVAMHVVVMDKVKHEEFNQVVRFRRDIGNDARVEFDSSWGTYRIVLSVPRYGCSDIDYIEVLQGHDRSLNTSLADGGASLPPPVLIFGSLPVAFAYVQPSIVMFPASIKCDGPVGDLLGGKIDNELEQDAYYSALRAPEIYTQPPTVRVALQLKDSSGGYHYVRVPFKFTSNPTWASPKQFNIDEGSINWIAEQPEDTLLCPKGYMTTVG